METYNRARQGEKGAWTSITAYLCLSAVKLTVGYMFASEALRADGWNNFTDIVSSIAILVGLKISQKPPDHDHHYGHHRAETVASLLASFIMAAVGVQVLIQAFRKTLAPSGPPDITAAWTALLCSLVLFAVYAYNLKLAKRTDSRAVKAVALDNRSDALVSAGAFVGITASYLGWAWIDPATAAIVGLIICRTAWAIFLEASHMLTDGFDERQLQPIRETIRKTPGVKSVRDLKGRMNGHQALVEAVIYVDRRLSVEESHAISDEVEDRVVKRHKVANIHIHIEPM